MILPFALSIQRERMAENNTEYRFLFTNTENGYEIAKGVLRIHLIGLYGFSK